MPIEAYVIYQIRSLGYYPQIFFEIVDNHQTIPWLFLQLLSFWRGLKRFFNSSN